MCIFDIIVPQRVTLAAAVGHQHPQCAAGALPRLSCFSSYPDPSCPERGRNPHHEVPTVAKDGWSERIGVSITACGCFQTTGHGRTPADCWGGLSPVASPAARPQ